ncbi:hypothetical protein C4D60_Mb10t28850 [Musa balbisiana]|uniref:Uncharacterized protein n=1 Tax=Musa balbisiana TaxID=52838 RepID=A0A4S8J0G4_MUSBA|nr:hypothetical protein C4D60_Mb10t28850 [Musa balbisiana]
MSCASSAGQAVFPVSFVPRSRLVGPSAGLTSAIYPTSIVRGLRDAVFPDLSETAKPNLRRTNDGITNMYASLHTYANTVPEKERALSPGLFSSPKALAA